jgi:hypothetical protein
MVLEKYFHTWIFDILYSHFLILNAVLQIQFHTLLNNTSMLNGCFTLGYSTLHTNCLVNLLSTHIHIIIHLGSIKFQPQQQTNSVALSLRANYTDWATATCRRNLVSTFVDSGVSRGQRGGSPMVVNLSFLDRSRYFSFK